MKKHIVCLGDSNTHGACADPADSVDGALGRFNEDERWTCRLQNALGEGYLVLEEGLSGRTTVFRDPLTEGLAAIDYLFPCLMSHKPVSLLIVMLGTNDTKERFGANAACIALGMERLARKAISVDCWARKKPSVLIVAPPAIGDGMASSPVAGCMGAGCAAKARELPRRLRETAELLGVSFLDAGNCAFNQVDFMHLTRAGHAALADKLAAVVPGLV